MVSRDHPTGTEALAGEAAALVRFDPRRYMYDPDALLEEAQADRTELDEYGSTRDLQAVFEKATQMKDQGEDRLRQLLRGRTVMTDAVAAVADLGAHLDLQATAGDPDGGDDLVSALLASAGDGSRPSVATSAVRTLAGDLPANAGTTAELLEATGLDDYPSVLRRQRDLAAWYVVSGYMLRAEASYYMMVKQTTPAEFAPEVLDAAEDELDRIRGGMMDRFRTIHAALAAEDWDGLEAAAWRGVSYPDEVGYDLYAMAWTLRRGRRYEEEHEDGAAGQAAKFARAEMELARALRHLGALLGAAHRYLFVARRDAHDEASREATAAAREKQFEPLVTDGVNVDLDDLLDGPGAYDGRLVEVEGFAENVRFDEEHTVTRFDLVDRLHDRRVPVYYPYHDLTDWHLRDDVYVRAEAEFAADSEYVGGPELQVDIVSLAENGEESWFDAVLHDLGRSDVFHVYPSQGNLFWSFEPPGPPNSGPGGENR